MGASYEWVLTEIYGIIPGVICFTVRVKLSGVTVRASATASHEGAEFYYTVVLYTHLSATT